MKENLGRFVFRKPLLFTLGLGLTMPYFLEYFDLKYLPDIRHCVYRDLAPI